MGGISAYRLRGKLNNTLP